MRFKETVWCDGCGVEIPWSSPSKAGRHFCCATCFAGEPCGCSVRVQLDDDRRAASSAPSLTVMAGD